MPEDAAGHAFSSYSDTNRCLSGIRMLLVDDSRSVSEAIRIMAIRSGARIRRADCLKSAARHLTIYRPDVVIVDLGLPDGSGADLAREILEEASPRPAVLLISAAEEEVTSKVAAEVGADGYLVKPISSFSDFQRAIVTLLPEELRPSLDGIGSVTVQQIGEDAFSHDLLNAQDLLKDALVDAKANATEFAAHFLLGVARTIEDGELIAASTAMLAALGSPGEGDAIERALGLVSARLDQGWAQAS